VPKTKLAAILRHAGLTAPHPIPTLPELDIYDFEARVSDEHKATAHMLLVQARVAVPSYRSPETQKRHLFRVPSRKSLKTDEHKWVFTKHEVGKALNWLLSQRPLPEVKVASALLWYAENLFAIDELWEHYLDPKLEKRQSSLFRRSTLSSVSTSNWVDIVTAQDNSEYVRLLCQIGVGQPLLNAAIRVALEWHAMGALKLLLQAGASITSSNNHLIQTYVAQGDIALINLLLSAPKGMNLEDWQFCLEPEIIKHCADGAGKSGILLQCIAHRPALASGGMLLKALAAQNLPATAIILAYSAMNDQLLTSSANLTQSTFTAAEACELASNIADDHLRYEFLVILHMTSLLVDCTGLQRELMRSVMGRRLSTVELLVEAGIQADAQPNSSIELAVSRMDLEILAKMKNAKFSANTAASLVGFLPVNAQEMDILRFLNLFSSRSLSGPKMDAYLVQATGKHSIGLVSELLTSGASIAYDKAAAVKIALANADLCMLKILLRGEINGKSLAAVLPTAMNIKEKSIRRKAVMQLGSKAIDKRPLIYALVEAIKEDGRDIELIERLVGFGLHVDGSHALHCAVQTGNLKIISLICNATLSFSLLSSMIPVAFSLIETKGYEVARKTIELLLQRGAKGPALHTTLLMAIKSDTRMDIVRLLVSYNADANYGGGGAFALALGNTDLLKILCARCYIAQETLVNLLPFIFCEKNCDLQTLEIVLSSAPSAGRVLNSTLPFDRLKGCSDLLPLFETLIRHGLDFNHQGGAMLRFSIEESNIALLKTFLSQSVTTKSLKVAFPVIDELKQRDVQLETMGLLLEKAGTTEIGQSKALYNETVEALSGNVKGLRLLLKHGAAIDFDSGKAVQLAAVCGSHTVLQILLPQKPSAPTICKACLKTAASVKLSTAKKQTVFQLLLMANGGLKPEDLSELLHSAVSSFPSDKQLPQTVISLGAEVKAETVHVALKECSREVFELLINNFKSANGVVELFSRARRTNLAQERRQWIYKGLLETTVIPREEVSEALLDILDVDSGEPNMLLVKMLLENGASIRHNNFAVLRMAFSKAPSNCLKLLVDKVKDDGTATYAFAVAVKSMTLKPEVRLQMYKSLLKFEIPQSILSRALFETIRIKCEPAVVQLLLSKGANPNEDNAKCFILAANSDDKATFQALSPYADIRPVLRILIGNFTEEAQALQWVSTLLKKLPSSKIKDDKIIVGAMMKFPSGNKLVRLLLEYGASASAVFEYSLCKYWASELVTPLIWALFTDQKISNSVLLALIESGKCESPKPLCYLCTFTNFVIAESQACVHNCQLAGQCRFWLSITQEADACASSSSRR
jgi:hypothetical protein